MIMSMNLSKLRHRHPCLKVINFSQLCTAYHTVLQRTETQELTLYELGVEGLTLPGSSFYAFYNPGDLSFSMRQSLNQLEDFVSAEGPFDAVLGFSGGAFLAAMYLIEQQSHRDSGKSNDSLIKCGIFLASASCKAEMNVLGASTVPHVGKTSIQVPTAHIWGSNDTIAPTGGHDLSRICNAAKRNILVHEGGHELPRGNSLTKAVHIIRRTIDLAQDF